ncbi:MAG: DUF2339 domain-containing protein, partial [Pseudomonadota bacterium]|nr:DUF2339 domain-containing protein [Pseudomonadota bacterium]
MEQMFVLLALVVLAVPVLLIVCLVKLSGMGRRVGDLEADVQRLRGSVQAGHASVAAQPARAAQPQQSKPLEPHAPTLAELMEQSEAPVAPDKPTDAGTQEPARPAPVATSTNVPVTPLPFQTPPRRVEPARPNPVEVVFRRIKAWFTVGNVPVKIGMLVLLAGVAALLRYASDQGWLQMPIELRLAGISAAALVALVFAWR